MGQNPAYLMLYKYLQFIVRVFPRVDSSRVSLYLHTLYLLYLVRSVHVMLIPSDMRVMYGFYLDTAEVERGIQLILNQSYLNYSVAF